MAINHKRRKASQRTPSPAKSFAGIMDETTRDLPHYRRVFSRFIHLRWVASFSVVVGSTLARPNAILFGAIASFSLTLVAYLLSKNLGYSLSGFESIGAFIIGWIAGIIFDAVSNTLKDRS